MPSPEPRGSIPWRRQEAHLPRPYPADRCIASRPHCRLRRAGMGSLRHTPITCCQAVSDYQQLARSGRPEPDRAALARRCPKRAVAGRWRLEPAALHPEQSASSAVAQVEASGQGGQPTS